MDHTKLNINIFPSQNHVALTGTPSPNRSQPMHDLTPETVLRSVGTSSRSWRLRSGALGGCTNCMVLEAILDGERKTRSKAYQHAREAHLRCLTLGTVLYKVGQLLNQENEELCTLRDSLRQRLIIPMCRRPPLPARSLLLIDNLVPVWVPFHEWVLVCGLGRAWN